MAAFWPMWGRSPCEVGVSHVQDQGLRPRSSVGADCRKLRKPVDDDGGYYRTFKDQDQRGQVSSNAQDAPASRLTLNCSASHS